MVVRRTLVWDVTAAGHHARYADAIVAAAPDDEELLLPDWAQSLDSAERSGRNVSFITQERGTLRATLRRYRPSTAILLDADQVLANPRLGRDARLICLDLQTPQVPLYRAHDRSRMTQRRLVSASVRTLQRIALAGATDIRFLSLNGWSADVGPRMLRDRSTPIRDPLEALPRAMAETEPGRLAMVGVLDRRKGLDLVVDALAQLPPADDWTLFVGGQVVPSYEAEFHAHLTRLRESGVTVEVEGAHLPASRLAAELSRAAVLLLAYRSHFGSSGLFGTFLSGGYRGSAVVSDFGWLGHIAQENSAVTFRDGDATALAAAIRAANLTTTHAGRSGPRPPMPLGFTTPQEFGWEVWAAVEGQPQP